MKDQQSELILKLFESGLLTIKEGSKNKQEEQAMIVLRLYELRRDPVMREARKWCTWTLNLATVNDYFDVLMSENSDKLRMVFSYWDMAACLVENGAISDELFNGVADEHMWMFSIIEPILEDVRKGLQRPGYLKHLENVIRRIPGNKEMLEGMRQSLKSTKIMAAERAKKG